jgi:hypothetical protein
VRQSNAQVRPRRHGIRLQFEQLLIKANRLLHIAAVIGRVGLPVKGFGRAGLPGGFEREQQRQAKEADAQQVRSEHTLDSLPSQRQSSRNTHEIDRHSSCRIAESLTWFFDFAVAGFPSLAKLSRLLLASKL